MNDKTYTLFAVGYGHLATEMLKTVDENPAIVAVKVIRPSVGKEYAQHKTEALSDLGNAAHVITHDLDSKIDTQTDAVIMLAPTPKDMEGAEFQKEFKTFKEALKEKFDGREPQIITVAAKHPSGFYHEKLGVESHCLTRLMPNTPIGIGQGVMPAYKAQNNREGFAVTQALFGRLSKVVECQTEMQFDQISPATGCMPGFVFELVKNHASKMAEVSDEEALRDFNRPEMIEVLAGEVSGAALRVFASENPLLAPEHAEALISGILSLGQQRLEGGSSLDGLIGEVATKGGLTEAGVNAMRDNAHLPRPEQLECAIRAASQNGGIALPQDSTNPLA